MTDKNYKNNHGGKNFYEVLGISSPDAGRNVILCISVAKVIEANVNKDKDGGQERLDRLLHIIKVLSDPDLRRKYDESISQECNNQQQTHNSNKDRYCKDDGHFNDNSSRTSTDIAEEEKEPNVLEESSEKTQAEKGMDMDVEMEVEVEVEMEVDEAMNTPNSNDPDAVSIAEINEEGIETGTGTELEKDTEMSQDAPENENENTKTNGEETESETPPIQDNHPSNNCNTPGKCKSSKKVYGINQNGKECRRCIRQGSFCYQHSFQAQANASGDEKMFVMVFGYTQKGFPCKRCIKQGRFCYQHDKQQSNKN